MRDGERVTRGRGRLFDSVLDTVGDTPCIRINTLAPRHVTAYVKAEFFNPAGSVKDRLALSIIETAERNGTLRPGQTVVEATSGNTGIGLAMVCAAKGYPLVVTMADSFSIERRRMMRFLGAKVVLTPRTAKGMGMYRKAQELAEANGWFFARQFETADNATIHEDTTGRGPRRGRVVALARRRRGHLRRHLGRRFAGGRDPGRRASAARLGALLHAARHRRALPVDAAVRGRRHRHDAGGGSALEVDAR